MSEEGRELLGLPHSQPAKRIEEGADAELLDLMSAFPGAEPGDPDGQGTPLLDLNLNDDEDELDDGDDETEDSTS